MARKEEQEDVEQQEDEGQDVEEEESGISINITEEAITIDLPRDGNEGETLGQLAKMVEGMSQ
ncbi:MAG TPA: hypothetical protein VGC63_01085 [Solirubrobacterales bacterium]|jgi:hypothetical protein